MKRAEEVRTEAKAEGNRKCEPGKPGKPRNGRKHKAGEEQADILGRRESGETGWTQAKAGVDKSSDEVSGVRDGVESLETGKWRVWQECRKGA